MRMHKDMSKLLLLSIGVLLSILLIIIIVFNITQTNQEVKAKKIVGYYAAWSSHSGFSPEKIDAEKLTHINYAFANIGSDLKITLGFPDVDEKNIKQLRSLKKINPKLKILISVGGWSWSESFSDAAPTEESRSIFSDSCVDFIVKYQLDGIDIDWEYPVGGGLPTNITRNEDKQNFTLLMKKLREKLDARGKIDGKDYILTFAGATDISYLNNIEVKKLSHYVDYVNVMSYDIHGPMDQYTDFNSPLFINNDVSPQDKWSVDAGIYAWLKEGLQKNKIIVGIPFYGHLYEDVPDINHGLYQPFSRLNQISYADLIEYYINTPGYKHYFHTKSKVPWLFNGTTFISFDGEKSIKIKANYVNEKGLGGAMIWELGQDYNNKLLNTIYDGLNE